MSSIGRLTALDNESRRVLEEEAKQAAQDGLNWIAIRNLKHLDNFVLEVNIITEER